MNVFISYDFKNYQNARQVEEWLKVQHTITMYRNKDLHPEHDQQGQDRIELLMRRIDKMVILIGEDGHNRPWLDFEVKTAMKLNKPIIPIRIPNTYGAAPSEIRNLSEVKFSGEVILEAL